MRRGGSRQGRRARAGPPLGPVIGVSIALFLASLAVPAVVTGGLASPSQPLSDEQLAGYVAEHADALAWSALFRFAASVPLIVFGAAAAAQLGRVGVRAAGPVIGLAGAVLASGALALAGLLHWVLAQADPQAPLALLVALHDLAFVTGGPWHIVGLGLLVAGIAVPALVYGLLPRWLAVAGIAVAGACELTTLALVIDPIAEVIALARYPALLWLLTVAWMLPATPRSAVQS